MKITIDFGHPYFEEEVLLGLTQDDLNCFYGDASEVDRLNLFFVLEAYFAVTGKSVEIKHFKTMSMLNHYQNDLMNEVLIEFKQ